MTIHAWSNYKKYAWGKNELRPVSGRAHTGSIFGAYELGATIVDGLDTLYIMDLKQEYNEGREWVKQNFSFNNLVNIKTNIQINRIRTAVNELAFGRRNKRFKTIQNGDNQINSYGSNAAKRLDISHMDHTIASPALAIICKPI